MARESRSANEIRAFVQARIDLLPGLAKSQSHLRVDTPLLRAPDGQGCNWEIAGYSGDAIMYLGAMKAIIDSAKSRFLLAQSA